MRLLVFINLFFLVLSCKEEDLNRNYPLVKTFPVSGISAEGATFAAEFSNAKSSDIIAHGFVWGKDKVNLAIGQTSAHAIQLGVPVSSQFHYTEKSSLESGATYYVRGFVQTKQNVIYGTMVSFKSLGASGPILTDFSPKSGKQGDILTISGNNFGQESKYITVTFSTDESDITVAPIEVSNTSIKVAIPETLYARTSLISVELAGTKVQAAEPFKLEAPEIESISSTSLTACDSLTIQWISHGFTIGYVAVNNYSYPFVVSGNKIKLSVKDAGPNLSVRIQSGLFYDSKTFANTPISKALLSVFPSSISSGDTLKIRFNFHTNCHILKATVMGNQLAEVGRTINEIWVVPGQIPQSPQQISVFADDVLLSQSSPITIIYKGWTRKQDFTGTSRTGAVGFSINGKGYMALGEDSGGLKNDLWEYDPINDQWTQKAQFPGPARLYASSFVVNGMAYVGTGQTHSYGSAFKDFWQYDPNSNSWTQKGDYPGGERYRGCVTFTLGSKGYMGSGQKSISTIVSTDFWEYESTNDTWTAKAAMPESYGLLTGFSLNSKGYAVWAHSGTSVRFMYDPATNTWDSSIAQAPIGNPYYYPFAFQHEVYYLSENGPNANKVFRVDPVTNTWTFVQYHGATFSDFYFVVNQKAYMGATSNPRIYELDPSKL